MLELTIGSGEYVAVYADGVFIPLQKLPSARKISSELKVEKEFVGSRKPSDSIRERIDELFERWRKAKTEINRTASLRKVSERTFIEGI